MSRLIAFHGSQNVKDKYLARVQTHRIADELIRGTGWDLHEGKGCAVGCTLDAYEHSRYETELGIPIQIAYLEDDIFEHLAEGEWQTWPERFLAAIPVGADLSRVYDRFALWMLTDEKMGTLAAIADLGSEYDDVRAAVRGIAALFQKAIDGQAIDPTEEEKAMNAAWAAWDARDAWDAWDAWAAWDARDARDAWAAWAAWDARVKASADKLLELLAAAPVVVLKK